MLISRCIWRSAPRSRYATHTVHDLTSSANSVRDYHGTSRLLLPSKVLSFKSLYVDTQPPNTTQTSAAERFFRTHLPTKSWTATEWRGQPHSDTAYLTPEVVFLGRSNTGKSSLLNGLLYDDKLCRVGAKPGKTRLMHAWSLSPLDAATRGARKGYQGDMEPKLTVLDFPGYGHGSRDEWGKDIVKYLTSRRQLRRAFLLVNPVHGLKNSDLQMLRMLRGYGISHQLIACKCDAVKSSQLPALLHNLQESLKKFLDSRNAGPTLMTINDVLAVGNLEQGMKGEKHQGLQDVRWAMLRATGLEEYALAQLAGRSKRQPAKFELAALSATAQSSEAAVEETSASQQVVSPDHVEEAIQLPLPEPEPELESESEPEHQVSEVFRPMGQATEQPTPAQPTNRNVPVRENIGLSIEDFLSDTGPTAEIERRVPKGGSVDRSLQQPKLGGRRRPSLRAVRQ